MGKIVCKMKVTNGSHFIDNKLLKYLITEIKKNKNIRLLKLWVKDSQVIAKKLYENMGFEFKNRVGEHTITMEKILSF